jgi:DNA-binding response OmpR family regulator
MIKAVSSTDKSVRILIVEDEGTLRTILGATLRRFEPHWEVVEVCDGNAAIKAFAERPFDVVVTDIIMPGISGVECVEALRGTGVGFETVLMSAYIRDENVVNGMAGIPGAVFLSKPFQPQEFLEADSSAALRKKCQHNESVILRQPEHPEAIGDASGDLLVETTSAFIHKLTNEFAMLKVLVEEMGQDSAEKPGDHNVCWLSRQSKLRGAITSIGYLLERFRNIMGRHPGMLRPVDIGKVLLDVQKHLADRLPCQLALTPPAFTCQVAGDYELLWHLFENLIRNALEATGGREHGKVEVAMSTDRVRKLVLVVVHDNGDGITAENLRRVFDLNFSTKPKGMGIGLYLARRATKVHGGQIECQSEPGLGTTFTVSLPLPI